MKARLFIIIVVLGLAAPGAAWAHATLVRTDPANGAVLQRGPAQVRVVFDDVVRVGPGVAAVRNDGGTILAGSPRIAGERSLVIPLERGLEDGAYSVRWAIVSDHGHLESGVLAFAVGAGTPSPTPALRAGANEPQAGSVASRWLFLAGVLASVGVALLGFVARSRDDERIALVLSSAAVLTALGAAQEVHRIGLDTRAGTAFGAGFVAAVVIATLAGAATLERRALRPALVLALGLAIVPSVSGHALDKGLNRINVVADVLHVLGASAWVGALLGLVLLRETPRRRAILLAAGGVVLLGATGILRAWFELVRFSQLWDTSYGQTLLVKTGLLLVALAVGWILRANIRRRAAVELVVVAGIVVAVSVLVLLRPGRNVEAEIVQRVQATEPSPPPTAPAADAVLLARQLGPLGVALQLEPKRTTAVVLSPAGGGLSGLDVRLDGTQGDPCGHGCYRVQKAFDGSVDVDVDGFGPRLSATFDLPRLRRSGDALLSRAEERFRRLRSVFFVERLASGPSHHVTSLWRVEAPNRVAYSIPGGAQGIVIDGRRWDRGTPDGVWRASEQTPLEQPVPQWNEASNIHVVEQTADTVTLTFVDPLTPAYFEVTYSSRTLLPRVVRMTASAHFMTDSYLRFNAPREIFPPR